jgi:hypothetical protein
MDYDNAEDKSKLKIMNPDIIDTLTTPSEISGLLNEALDGLQRLFKQKAFSTTKGSDYVKSFWIRKSNSFIAFCMDEIEEDGEGYITKKELRKQYSNYCKKHNISGKSDIVIKRVLQETFGANEERKVVLDVQETIWSGIKLKKEVKKLGLQPFSAPRDSFDTYSRGSKSMATLTISQIVEIIGKITTNEITLEDLSFISDNVEFRYKIIDKLIRSGTLITISENKWRKNI